MDILTFNLVFFLCSMFSWDPFVFNGMEQFKLFIISNISYFVALQFVVITLHHRLLQPAKVLSNTSRTSLLFTVIYIAILGMSGMEVPDWGSSLLMTLAIFIATTAERLIFRTYIQNRRSMGHNSVSTVIIGSGDMVQKAADVMTNPWNGYNLLGFFSDVPDAHVMNKTAGGEVPHLGGKDSVMQYLEDNHVNELYIAAKTEQPKAIKELLKLCERKMIRTFYIPTAVYKEFREAKVTDFGDIYVMSQYSEPLKDVRNRIKKRIFDVLFSLFFLCTFFPIILLIVAIISKITMPGPLFFKQKRTGYDGKDFTCYKFRSMKVNKDSDKVQATKDDPRVTKWGLFMRHANIDELPQFINVLKGDMSIVGPRPHMLAHTDYYSSLISDYMIRHYAKPGITGWAQTHGERGETKTVEDMKRRVEKDIWYIGHWSFWLDIQIIMKTIQDAVHGDDKAY